MRCQARVPFRTITPPRCLLSAGSYATRRDSSSASAHPIVTLGLDPRALHFQSSYMAGYTYILADMRRGRTYIGVTNDLHRRIFEHREGLADGRPKRTTSSASCISKRTKPSARHSARENPQALVPSVERSTDRGTQLRLAEPPGRDQQVKPPWVKPKGDDRVLCSSCGWGPDFPPPPIVTLGPDPRALHFLNEAANYGAAARTSEPPLGQAQG
jgi:hypothetical protein